MTMEKPRLFFALATPGEILAQIAPLARTLQDAGADARWEPTAKMHCTVKFLGETGTDLIERIREKASAVSASCPVLTVRYRGLGAFPSLRDPRVVWAGLEETSGALAHLHGSLEADLAELGFEPERRAFHPHLTLGRVRGRRNLNNLIRLLESLTLESEPARLTEMLLMKSQLLPSGSVYTALQAFPFHQR
jgi:2'-5' RNA ligase